MMLERLYRQDLQSLTAYQTYELQEMEISLSANELPWDPVAAFQWACNRYPTQQSAELSDVLADIYQIKSENMMLTAGSDSSIDHLLRLFITPYVDSVMVCPPTFSMYQIFAKLQGAKIMECPLDTAYRLDITKLIEKIDENTKLIFICSPNNPTGGSIKIDDIEKLCMSTEGRSVIVVDEAYIEFSLQPSSTQLLGKYQNIVVLRTLSKAYGLAGLRLGATIAHPALINKLKAIAPPYEVAQPSIQLALIALKNRNWYQEKIALIVEQRQQLIQQMQSIESVTWVGDSDTNFIFFKVSNAMDLQNYLKTKNIDIRKISNSECRVSIGLEQENKLFIKCLKQWGKQ